MLYPLLALQQCARIVAAYWGARSATTAQGWASVLGSLTLGAIFLWLSHDMRWSLISSVGLAYAIGAALAGTTHWLTRLFGGDR